MISLQKDLLFGKFGFYFVDICSIWSGHRGFEKLYRRSGNYIGVQKFISALRRLNRRSKNYISAQTIISAFSQSGGKIAASPF
ncbi:hypothetical protein D2910_05985 [Planomicrobium okeanokoites]|nr:hypothetical protein D2910_05985 [Planomicrobium okeanokoites]